VRIVEKCKKFYRPNCSLAVSFLPDLTPADEMELLLSGVNIPANIPFDGIYLCGEFPAPIRKLLVTDDRWAPAL
jgi:hypothetical protein